MPRKYRDAVATPAIMTTSITTSRLARQNAIQNVCVGARLSFVHREAPQCQRGGYTLLLAFWRVLRRIIWLSEMGLVCALCPASRERLRAALQVRRRVVPTPPR